MHIEVNKDTRFSIGDRIYFWKDTIPGAQLVSDVVVAVEARFTENWTNIAYMTQMGDIVYDFRAFASEEEYREHQDIGGMCK